MSAFDSQPDGAPSEDRAVDVWKRWAGDVRGSVIQRSVLGSASVGSMRSDASFLDRHRANPNQSGQDSIRAWLPDIRAKFR
jgi:hypothetical protein